MRLRRYESWVVGVDQGVPFEERRRRHFTRFGANRYLNHALYSMPAMHARMVAARTGWDISIDGEVRTSHA